MTVHVNVLGSFVSGVDRSAAFDSYGREHVCVGSSGNFFGSGNLTEAEPKNKIRISNLLCIPS